MDVESSSVLTSSSTVGSDDRLRRCVQSGTVRSAGIAYTGLLGVVPAASGSVRCRLSGVSASPHAFVTLTLRS